MRDVRLQRAMRAAKRPHKRPQAPLEGKEVRAAS